MVRAAAGLRAGNLQWPLATIEELTEQLGFHRDRHAGYEARRVGHLITEMQSRARIAAGDSTTATFAALGSKEKGETPLRRAMLIGLGCRIRGEGDRTAEIFLAQPDTGLVLVWRRSWPSAVPPAGTSAGTQPRLPSGSELAGRRVAGSTVRSLASGQVVTESAVRTAGRVLRIAVNTVARTSVTPGNGDWGEQLAPRLLVTDFQDARRELGDLPSRLIRPRVAAELVRAVAVSGVESIRYDPGEQRLEAVILDDGGHRAIVAATYRGSSPGALDALATALTSAPLWVSGTLARRGSDLLIDPLAVVVADPSGARSIVVPDLVAGEEDVDHELSGARTLDPIEQALDDAAGLLADAVHRGLDALPPSFADRIDEVAETLEDVGLARTAELVRAIRPGSPDLADAWFEASLRVDLAAEFY